MRENGPLLEFTPHGNAGKETLFVSFPVGLELVGDPRCEVVDVFARQRLFEERPGEEVDLAGQNRDMPRHLPRDGERGCTADITCPAHLPGSQ
jgi:hypothetical protein